MLRRKKLNPQTLFPLLGLAFGLFYALVTPPFQAPDETNHFYRIIQIAQGQYIPEKRGNMTGGVIPHSAVIVGESFIRNIIHNPENKITATTFSKACAQPLNPHDTVYFSFPNSSLYSPVNYIPQLLFIKPALLLGVKPIWLAYGGRIANVLISLFLLTLAIRLLPAFHWSFFLVVFLPMYLFQTASLSADSFLNSLCLLTWAMAVRMVFMDKYLTTATVLKILPLVILLGLCKAGYLFLLLLFILPAFSITERKEKLHWLAFAVVSFCGAVLLASVWSMVIKTTFSPYGNPNINPDGAIAFIKANPVMFTVMILKNIAQNLHWYAYGIVGYLGWLDVRLPFYLIILYWGTLIIVFYTEHIRQFEFSGKQHIFMTGLAVAISIVVIVSQYIVTTPAGSTVIERSQGRYFLPVLLPLISFVRVKRFKNFRTDFIERHIDKIVPAVTMFASIVAFFSILTRYYNF